MKACVSDAHLWDGQTRTRRSGTLFWLASVPIKLTAWVSLVALRKLMTAHWGLYGLLQLETYQVGSLVSSVMSIKHTRLSSNTDTVVIIHFSMKIMKSYVLHYITVPPWFSHFMIAVTKCCVSIKGRPQKTEPSYTMSESLHFVLPSYSCNNA